MPGLIHIFNRQTLWIFAWWLSYWSLHLNGERWRQGEHGTDLVLNCRKVGVPPVELFCMWAQIPALFRDSEPMGLELPLAHLGLVSLSGWLGVVTLETSFKVTGVITSRLLSYTRALQISEIKAVQEACVWLAGKPKVRVWAVWLLKPPSVVLHDSTYNLPSKHRWLAMEASASSSVFRVLTT